MIAENADQLFNVSQVRHIFQRQRIIRQQRRDHQWQGRILGTGNRDDAIELVTANNLDTIHNVSLSRG